VFREFRFTSSGDENIVKTLELRLKYYTHRTRCPKGQELIFVFHICLAFIFLSDASFFLRVASLLKSTVGQRRPSALEELTALNWRRR